jgi:hypothetical protein
MTLTAEDWDVMRGLNNALSHVNAVSHDLYDFLYPLHVRERRACNAILRYDACWPVGDNGFTLKYRVKYTVPCNTEAVGPVYLTGRVLKQNPGG